MNEKSQRLSLCMIVKNEEEVLPRCLKSVRSLVDEIIIVDTGSTDSTVSVAKEFGAKIYEFTWDNNFSNARNFSLLKASGGWVLVLDADEILVYDDTDRFKLLLHDPDTEAYLIRIVNLLGASSGTETSEDLVLRLFRNRPEYRFSGAIHEQVYPSVINSAGIDSIKEAPLIIYHDGYLSERILMKNKIHRNLQVIQKALNQNPRDPFLLYSLGCEYFLSEEYEKALEIFKQALPLIGMGNGYLSDLVIKLGLSFYKLGKTPEMLSLFDNLKDISPLSSEVLFLGGLINLETGNLSEAEQNIKECLERLPGNSIQHLNIREYQVYQALGEIYEAKKLWDDAVRFYFRAIQSKPVYLYPLQKIINLYKRRKPELPVEEILGFCPPETKCTLLEKINWQTEEDIAVFLILGLVRDVMLSDSYVSQLLRPAVLSVLNSQHTENTGMRIVVSTYLAKAITSLGGSQYTGDGHTLQTCLNLAQNIREILILQNTKEEAVND